MRDHPFAKAKDCEDFKRILAEVHQKTMEEVRAFDPSTPEIVFSEKEIEDQWRLELTIREGRTPEPTLAGSI